MAESNHFDSDLFLAESKDDVAKAYNDVVSGKSETNWLLLDYESDSSEKVTLTQTGTGGLEELVEHLDELKGSYAFIRVTFSNDKESTRQRFVVVYWVGSKCRGKPKSKMIMHRSKAQAALQRFGAIEITAAEKDDLKEDVIVPRLRKAGGASYDRI